MSISASELSLVLIFAGLAFGWTLWRYKVARWIAAVLVLANLLLAIANADEAPPGDAPTASAAPETAERVAPEDDGDRDGDRDWGRDDGIATRLSPGSKLIVGAGFLVVLGLVIWIVSYRKPDGAAYQVEGNRDGGPTE